MKIEYDNFNGIEDTLWNSLLPELKNAMDNFEKEYEIKSNVTVGCFGSSLNSLKPRSIELFPIDSQRIEIMFKGHKGQFLPEGRLWDSREHCKRIILGDWCYSLWRKNSLQ